MGSEPELGGGELHHAHPERAVLLVGAPREQPPCRQTHASGGGAGRARGGGHGGRPRAPTDLYAVGMGPPDQSPQHGSQADRNMHNLLHFQEKESIHKATETALPSFLPSFLRSSALLGERPGAASRPCARRRGGGRAPRAGDAVPEPPPPLYSWSRLRK